MPFFDAIQPPLAEPVAALESVIVSASRSQTRLDEMPLHTTVLDQQDIAAQHRRAELHWRAGNSVRPHRPSDQDARLG
jgi:hypothetical protein